MRRKRILSQKRPAAGREARERASFLISCKRYSWKFFLCTKGENGIMERETEPEEQLPVIR